ncbi:hypothetical protein L914_06574 [Phytophthora nicotianae]|uniref:BZIP domain-containing protein n=1 Tax=Phytophthora nicotianae TaxID=4792 RepID=W2NK92_PHYNI|nr:hypothetical protein L914_06574 [Phytophthora nicotianae]
MVLDDTPKKLKLAARHRRLQSSQRRLWGEQERVAIANRPAVVPNCVTLGLVARIARRRILFSTVQRGVLTFECCNNGQHARGLFFQLHCFLPCDRLHRRRYHGAAFERREFIPGFTRYSNNRLQPARLEAGPTLATITTAIATTTYSMPSMPPSVQPLSISLDFFDMADMNAEHHTPLSSASSSSSELSKPSPCRKLKKRSSPKVLSTKRLSNEEKQAKNRLFVKRCYYKKREALKNLREEVAQLEGEFATVLQRWQERNEHSAEAFRDGKRHITPQDLYAELTIVRSSLVEEQQRLNLRLADRHLFRQRLQQLYEPTR